MDSRSIRRRVAGLSDHDARYEYKQMVEKARRQGGMLLIEDATLLRFLSIRLGIKLEWQRIELGVPCEIKEGWHGS